MSYSKELIAIKLRVISRRNQRTSDSRIHGKCDDVWETVQDTCYHSVAVTMILSDVHGHVFIASLFTFFVQLLQQLTRFQLTRCCTVPLR